MLFIRKFMARFLGLFAAYVWFVLPLFGQEKGVGRAPDVSSWPAILTAVLLLAVILSGSFKSSKRGHQD